MIQSAIPVLIFAVAMAILSKPLAQYRLMVIPATSIPKALAEIIRPNCKPCSASGTALPTITSSTRFASNCGMVAISPLITSTARSSGRKKRNPPFLLFVTAVLKPATIYASCMTNDFCYPNVGKKVNSCLCNYFLGKFHSGAFRQP